MKTAVPACAVPLSGSSVAQVSPMMGSTLVSACLSLQGPILLSLLGSVYS